MSIPRYTWRDDGSREWKPLYNVWRNMRKRCLDSGNPWYYNYGARGITICSEWDDYEVFHAWAKSSGYKRGLELDRIDGDGPYHPDNCRWADRITQCLHKRTTIQVPFRGEIVPLPALAREYGINIDKLRYRYRVAGWPIERCLELVEDRP